MYIVYTNIEIYICPREGDKFQGVYIGYRPPFQGVPPYQNKIKTMTTPHVYVCVHHM